MRDFEKLVSDNLSRIPRADRDEIVRELSGHLQERYEELLAAGAGEHEAATGALAEVGDWGRLRKGIVRAKEGDMTARAKTILIPGVVALLFTGLGEQLLMNAGVRPTVYWRYISWMTSTWQLLAIFVVAGAFAAAWSRAAGGGRSQRLWAAEFPAMCMLLVFAFLFTVGPVIEMSVAHRLRWAPVGQLFVGFLFWNIMLPGCALLLGTLPSVVAKGRAPANSEASPA